ncbi:hypothetical protein DEA8626_02716 [Defluviimonas aquaemixtae]|uniref:Uncharacterized protein n=1 Tax=Albidovulum aquaemixtae TaxID=1542388 RepID=A0A2R8BK34_9RHOB|nr:hypothetical protein [Defluviimonas aquaemixtae]SPH23650.1 hypothetical protein DEA8626_02716 [Defluviimonas aquaemixtae]
MIWIYVLVAAALASEAFLRLPLIPVIRRVTETSRKSSRVLTSKRISDHWKEKILPSYAWVIGKGSVQFFAMLCLALLPVAALGLIFPGGMSAWVAALMRPAVIAVLCIGSILYIWLRLKVARA